MMCLTIFESPDLGRGSAAPVKTVQDRAILFSGRFSDEMRFWTHVEIVGECWVCRLKGSRGYTRFRVNGRSVFSHRWSWDLFNPPLKPTERLDHKCRNRACVNPEHLRILDSRTNTLIGEGPAAKNAKKTHCPYGHPYDEINTFLWRRSRACRICKQAKDRRLYWRKRGKDMVIGSDFRSWNKAQTNFPARNDIAPVAPPHIATHKSEGTNLNQVTNRESKDCGNVTRPTVASLSLPTGAQIQSAADPLDLCKPTLCPETIGASHFSSQPLSMGGVTTAGGTPTEQAQGEPINTL